MMQAMILEKPKSSLRLATIPIPEPKEEEVLLKVIACAVCRTDLHIRDGELAPPSFPLILGHQVVGVVARAGPNAKRFKAGQRVGVPWLAGTCGKCRFCTSNQENLCVSAEFTGFSRNGGFAEYCTANENYCHVLPDAYMSIQAAPLLCGGLIGFRAYRMAKGAKRLGFYGFGSSAHVLTQIAGHEDKQVYAFTREGDKSAQSLALKLGAAWAGSSEESPPDELDAAIIFAPVGKLIPRALEAIVNGGSVICAGIHMSDIPSFPYQLIYGEKILRSVAHLTRKDGEEFFKTAASFLICTQVAAYPLQEVNRALQDLADGKITGSAVIVMQE